MSTNGRRRCWTKMWPSLTPCWPTICNTRAATAKWKTKPAIWTHPKRHDNLFDGEARPRQSAGQWRDSHCHSTMESPAAKQTQSADGNESTVSARVYETKWALGLNHASEHGNQITTIEIKKMIFRTEPRRGAKKLAQGGGVSRNPGNKVTPRASPGRGGRRRVQCWSAAAPAGAWMRFAPVPRIASGANLSTSLRDSIRKFFFLQTI